MKMTFAKTETPLPDGTRVFIRNAFLFGDNASHVGFVRGWHVSMNKGNDGVPMYEPSMEYLIQFGKERHWIDVESIEGFLAVV